MYLVSFAILRLDIVESVTLTVAVGNGGTVAIGE